MKPSPISVTPLIVLALVLGGCGRSAHEDEKGASAKASAQALTQGTSDGTRKVLSKEAAAESGGPAPKVNPLATPLKVIGEDPAATTSVPPANPENAGPTPTPTPTPKA